MPFIGNKPTAVPLTGADIQDSTITSNDISYPLTTFSSTGIDDNATSTAITIDSNETSTLQCSAGDSNFALLAYHPTSTGTRTIAKFQSNVGGTQEDKVVILTSGIVLVGKTTSGVSAVGAELRDGVSNYCFTGTSSSEGVLLLNRTTSTGDIARFRYNNTGVGDISVTASSTSYNTSSDYRLKENVSYDFDATTRLKQLKPARFNFITDADTTVDGFLAHEVSDIVPEAISGEKDAVDENGNPKYQGIDQSKLVPLLVKTIQELEARITALENK